MFLPRLSPAFVADTKAPMSLSNAASFVVLPPVNLIGTALLGAVAALRWRRTGVAVALVSLVALLALAMPATSDLLAAGLEANLPLTPSPGAPPPGAIVVLGGDVTRVMEGPSVVGPLSLERVRAAAALARRTGLPILVSGGVTNDGGAEVCAVMADSLEHDFNVPVRWRECRSLDTWENAAFSAPMLQADGIRSAYVVTHAWHMKRGLLAFGPTGLAVTAAPTGLDAGPDLLHGGLTPTAGGLHRAYYTIHEWVGLAYYKWRLTR